MRKEKEIAEARLEVIQAEANRYKQQNDYMDKQLQDTNKALAEERNQAQVSYFEYRELCIVINVHKFAKFN